MQSLSNRSEAVPSPIDRLSQARAVWRQLASGLCFAAYLWQGLTLPAHAYVDPGTGSMVWQMALSALIGIGFFFRSIGDWWRRLFKR